MRTALISDIHGNFDGLRAVLDHIAGQHCDRILCLGDLIDGGRQSREVIEELRQRNIPIVRGNHDESAFWDDSLLAETRAYLQSLPEDITEGDTIYTHSSPFPRRGKVRDATEAWNVFAETSWRLIFVGDVHVPLIFGCESERKGEATPYPVQYDEDFRLNPDDRYIVCVGAIGYSRDHLPRLRYVIYDDARNTIRFHAPDGPIFVL